VVLPELAICGYVFRSAEEARDAAETLDGPTVRMLRALTAELGCVVVCGLAERAESGEVYNSAVVVEEGTLRGCVRKVHLWGRESQLFTAASTVSPPVQTSLGRIAVLICYDLEFPEMVRLAAEAGADVVAAPSNWPLIDRPAGERPLEVVKAQAFAGTYRLPVVVADRCGVERGIDWIGGSLICAASGYPVAGPATAYGETTAPALLIADLDLRTARDTTLGPFNDAFGDRRPELYRA
jgi:predicted amidohydrolase